MCIVSNWVNEAQDFITVTKYDDLPNSLIPSVHVCEQPHTISAAAAHSTHAALNTYRRAEIFG